MNSAAAVVLDRDGVINVDTPGEYIKHPDEWQPIPGSLEAIARLTASGRQIFVVSNQSGVGRGLFTLDVLEAIHQKMRLAVAAAGGELTGIYFCPHRPEDGCDCRKPATGMLSQISEEWNLTLDGMPFVGDKAADMDAARAVGARAMLVLTGHGSDTLAAEHSVASEIFPDLAAAVDAIVRRPA